MQAVVFDRDRQIRLVDRPEPTLWGTGVLLRPSYVGICGTDLHAEVLDHFRPGVVMGHEFSARVVAVGGEVDRAVPGELVVVNPNGNLCGSCEACLAGRSNLCSSAVFRRGIGIHEDGGMAELVAVDQRVLFAVPPEVTAERAAWVEPLATAVRAVRRGGCDATTSVLVVGAGPIGLLVTHVLRDLGVARIDVVERSPYRREFARRAGADNVLESINAGRGSAADVSFECSGSTGGFRAATAGVREDGTVVVLGLATEPLAIEPFRLVGSELTLTGSIIYAAEDFATALTLLREGRVEVESLTTAIMPLGSHEEAFRRLRESTSAIKILLKP